MANNDSNDDNSQNKPKRKRGRPPGSKNKAKQLVDLSFKDIGDIPAYTGKVTGKYLSTYDEQYGKAIVALADEGISVTQFLSTYNIPRQTFNGWKKNIPEFNVAVDLACVKREAFYEKLLQKQARSGKLPAILKILDARHGWAETGKGNTINVNNTGDIRIEFVKKEGREEEEGKKVEVEGEIIDE